MVHVLPVNKMMWTVVDTYQIHKAGPLQLAKDVSN
jgi:hypothetical protein